MILDICNESQRGIRQGGQDEAIADHLYDGDQGSTEFVEIEGCGSPPIVSCSRNVPNGHIAPSSFLHRIEIGGHKGTLTSLARQEARQLGNRPETAPPHTSTARRVAEWNLPELLWLIWVKVTQDAARPSNARAASRSRSRLAHDSRPQARRAA